MKKKEFILEVMTQQDRLKKKGVNVCFRVSAHNEVFEVYNESKACREIGCIYLDWSEEHVQSNMKKILTKLKSM